MSHLFFYLVGVVCGAVFGWRLAHQTVAEECARLGGFYVGRRTFQCIEIDDARLPWPNTDDIVRGRRADLDAEVKIGN